MAASQTKVAQELTPDELNAFCESLRSVPAVEQAAKIQELAKAKGISIGKTAAYEFKNKELMPWLKRLQLRKEKAAAIAEMEDDDSGRTLADAAAAELGQIAFDLVSELDGQIDLQTKEGRAVFNEITKGIHRLRTGDRAMMKQMAEQLKILKDREEETKEDLGNKQLTEEDRAARMRARFGL